MQRTSNLRIKSASELQPGELFRFSFGAGSSLALFISRFEEMPLIGVIQSDSFIHPMTWYGDGNLPQRCLSYGADWVIEEEHGVETACGSHYSQQGASLAISDNGLVMRFRAPERTGRYHYIHYDLELNEQVDFNPRSAPINKWRIWESFDHRDSGQPPLFEMPVAEETD